MAESALEPSEARDDRAPAAATGEDDAPTATPSRHASESYFVIGEGLLTTSGAGRARVAAAADDPPFRFSRMGPKGRAVPVPILRKLADAMTRGGGGQTGVPAGYTYLGQFLDHDLTMDRTTVTFGTNVTPAAMIQGRSPTLDLDSLYGAGPGDEVSERFYDDDGLTLLVGRTDDGGPFDLPRRRKAALIPDPRNDENLAVAQTHLAFIRFHNRVVAGMGSVPAAKRFARARQRVVKHYQWMVRHDYLPRICDPGVVDDVFANGRKVFEATAGPSALPTMPIEFSVAAFRLGHSMIRGAYEWNAIFQDGGGTLQQLFAFSGTSGDLSASNRLPSIWPADWRRLIDFVAAGHPNLKAPPGRFNRAMRIDTRIVNPLDKLPPGSFGATANPNDPLERNLAFRNLVRANMVRLASGQDMVRRLQDAGVAVTALTRAQILDGAGGGAELEALTAGQRNALVERTPLWFYVLREAELGGGRLAGVGARIVAETFHRAIQASTFSIVRDASFTPVLGPDDATFNMADLLFFAFEGKASLLNPVGG